MYIKSRTPQISTFAGPRNKWKPSPNHCVTEYSHLHNINKILL